MSTTVFDISEYYRKRLPRGTPIANEYVFWSSAGQDPLTITPPTSPENYTYWISELWINNNSISFSETTPGNGLVDITYPSVDGDAEDVIQITDMAQLNELANRWETINSNNYFVLEFDPPIQLFASKTKKTFTFAKNSNVTGVTAGDLTVIAKKLWKIKESSY